MSKSPARAVGRRKPCMEVADEFFSAAEQSVQPQAEPRDPAMLAAARMLSDALDRPSAQADAAARPGAVLVIRSPSAAWSPYLLRALRDVLPDSGFSRLSVSRRPASAPDSWHRRDENLPTWRLSTEARHATERADDLEEDVWSGYGVVGVSHDLAFLAPFLLEAADVVLEVAEPGVGVLLAASSVCCDGPAAWPRKESLPPITPLMLKAAYRNETTALESHDRMQTVLAGKAVITRAAPAADGWTLERLRGQQEFSAWGHGLAEDLTAWQAGELAWADVSPGCMLVGPPGTGKTSAAQALAGSCEGARFIPTSFSQWTATGRSYQGDTIRAMRACFDEAKNHAPCILFIDELDSIPARGQSREHDDYWRAIVNGLLECLDGVAGREGVIVIGAANDVSGIDAAILRSGRLDRVIEIGLPDTDALAEILSDHLGGGWHAADLGRAARLLLGRTGADAAKAVREARQGARQARRQVTLDDLLAACSGAPRDPVELRETALHEAAHAVVAEVRLPGSVEHVSLSVGGGLAGGCAVKRDGGGRLQDIEARVSAILAGRAAEELLLGGPQAGCGGPAESDLGLATAILLRARLCQGLYGEAAWRGDIGPGEVAAILRGRPDLHRWVEGRLAALQDEAMHILAEHEAELHAVTALLVGRTVLTGNEVRDTLSGCRNDRRIQP